MIRFAAVLALLLLLPSAGAAEPAQYAAEQAGSFGLDRLEKAGEPYTGRQSLQEGLDVDGALRYMADRAAGSWKELVRGSLRSSLLILSVVLLFSLADSVKEGTGGDPMGITAMTASLAVTAVAGR